ncbi:hypothetical protein [Spirulina sp. 06S082]|uniref:hypothetical protein n=1 Tax=Spirulina sp. 06S082 TaxID=3110248 RepID=UPI002B21F349|nr:hypothetical protein [Spirulina sp. 06S082]MEA5471553.1 hypothetical protein [Spirulina sp. 06S082]
MFILVIATQLPALEFLGDRGAMFCDILAIFSDYIDSDIDPTHPRGLAPAAFC